MKSVKDSLPIKNKLVLVFNKGIFLIDKRVISLDGEDWCWMYSNRYDVTHWQYLPKEPM